jgi:hypothetical protein
MRVPHLYRQLQVLPAFGEAYLFRDVTILQDIECHLATANLELASEPNGSPDRFSPLVADI